MREKLEFFPQRTMQTCGPACMLMLLYYFEKEPYTSRKKELRSTGRKQLYIYMKNRSEVRRQCFLDQNLTLYDDRMTGVTAVKAASYLAGQGLSVRLIHSSPEYMENRLCWFDPNNEVHWEYSDQQDSAGDGLSRNWSPYYEPDLFADMLKEYRAIVAECLRKYEDTQDNYSVSINPNFTYDTLKEELKKGRMLMVQTIVPGNADGIHSHVLHWILVYGYGKDEKNGEDIFLAADPLYGMTNFTPTELDNYRNTPIGQICISVGELTPEKT